MRNKILKIGVLAILIIFGFIYFNKKNIKAKKSKFETISLTDRKTQEFKLDKSTQQPARQVNKNEIVPTPTLNKTPTIDMNKRDDLQENIIEKVEEQLQKQSMMSVSEFKKKYKSSDLANWFRHSKPWSFDPESLVPNSVSSLKLKGINGETIRIRHSMGFARESLASDNDCFSLKLANGEPILGIKAEGTLEQWQTDLKWAYIFGIQNKHYFLYFFDARVSNSGHINYNNDSLAIFYFIKDAMGKFVYKGEYSGPDAEFTGKYPPDNSYDYCSNSY